MANPRDRSNGTPRWRFRWVLFGFLAVAGIALVLEHRAHLSGYLYYLPYLLLLACPLLHLFMHGGHGAHGDHAGHDHGRPTAPKGDDTGETK